MKHFVFIVFTAVFLLACLKDQEEIITPVVNFKDLKFTTVGDAITQDTITSWDRSGLLAFFRIDKLREDSANVHPTIKKQSYYSSPNVKEIRLVPTGGQGAQQPDGIYYPYLATIIHFNGETRLNPTYFNVNYSYPVTIVGPFNVNSYLNTVKKITYSRTSQFKTLKHALRPNNVNVYKYSVYNDKTLVYTDYLYPNKPSSNTYSIE